MAALAPVVPCLTYVPEVVNPPLAVLVPGRPFMTTRDAGFCRLLARFEVFLLAPVGTNEGMTDDLDGLLMQAVAALWDVVDVAEVGDYFRYESNGAQHLAIAVQVQTLIDLEEVS